jgi:dehydrogenase/reductase SDR family member 7B
MAPTQVVVITGASSGIGRALAVRYARAGYRLVLAARNLPQLQLLAHELLQHHKADAVVLQCDVTVPDDCLHLAQTAVAQFGQVDVCIANAGISMRASVQDVDLRVLHQVMDVNFWGAVHTIKACLPHVVARKGVIVGVSSIAGYVGLPERSGYSASKFALHGFLESLRAELLHTGTHVLLACPGYTASAIRERALVADGSPQGRSPRIEARMMTAEAVADAIFKAAERRQRTLVLTRQGKLTVLLKKFFPAFIARKTMQAMQQERAAEPAVADDQN